MTGRILLIGAGYSVYPLIHWASAEGIPISATSRDLARLAHLKAQGAEPIRWEAPNPLPASVLEAASDIVVSVGPGRDADADGCPVANAIDPVASLTGKRLIYLSSSGVYGDFDGGWVDEKTQCQPTTSRGQRRLAAEDQWRTIAEANGAALVCLRLSGIYGPNGRNALDTLLGQTNGARAGLGQRVIKPGQVFNRIHRDDIVELIKSLLGRSLWPDVINVSDDLPAPPQDVITYAAGLIGVEPPPTVSFEEAALSPMARSFYADNKRLRNDLLKSLLPNGLKYPTYKEGLDAIWAAKSSR